MAILDKVQKADEIDPTKPNPLKILLIGASGTGKTTGATTLPGRKLLIDLDGRSDCVAGFKNLSILKLLDANPNQPLAWFELEKLRDEIWSQVRQNKFPYDSLIVDGITALCKFAMNWALMLSGADGKMMSKSPGGGPSRPHYSPAMFALDRWINSILALPINILFTTHEELFEDEHLQTLTFYPKITGKLRTELANWFNESYLTTTTKGVNKIKYLWYTISGGDRRPFVKNSLNPLGKYWNDPIELDFDKKPNGFELLLEKRYGKEKEVKK